MKRSLDIRAWRQIREQRKRRPWPPFSIFRFLKLRQFQDLADRAIHIADPRDFDLKTGIAPLSVPSPVYGTGLAVFPCADGIVAQDRPAHQLFSWEHFRVPTVPERDPFPKGWVVAQLLLHIFPALAVQEEGVIPCHNSRQADRPGRYPSC